MSNRSRSAPAQQVQTAWRLRRRRGRHPSAATRDVESEALSCPWVAPPVEFGDGDLTFPISSILTSEIGFERDALRGPLRHHVYQR